MPLHKIKTKNSVKTWYTFTSFLLLNVHFESIFLFTESRVVFTIQKFQVSFSVIFFLFIYLKLNQLYMHNTSPSSVYSMWIVYNGILPCNKQIGYMKWNFNIHNTNNSHCFLYSCADVYCKNLKRVSVLVDFMLLYYYVRLTHIWVPGNIINIK